MRPHRTITGALLLASLVARATPAHAQGAPAAGEAPPPAAPAPAAEPPPAPAPPPAAPAPAAEPPPAPAPPAAAEAAPAGTRPAGAAPTVVVVERGANAGARREVKDGIRFRGGFSVNGGLLLLPNNPPGGAASLGARVGVQFNHYFAIFYQNTPIVGATMAHNHLSGTVVGADYNSVLANLTLFHMVELGAGPSLDYVGVAKGSITLAGLASTASGSTGTGVAAGGHARVAVNIGGLSGDGPRRSGFAIGVDAHPMFLSTGQSLSLTAGLGAEWY